MKFMSSTSTENSPGSVALHQQLWRVAQALQGIQEGRSGTAVLEQVPSSWRPGVQALLFQVLRSLGREDVYAVVKERGVIVIRDDLANHEYRFEKADIDKLFSNVPETPTSVH